MSQIEKKMFKFIFAAYVQTVTLALKFPCVVSVIWKRGEKASQVKQRKQIEKGIVTFNQKLQIECNMCYDSKKQEFQQKKAKFTILIFSEKGNKQAGQVYVDVAEILNKKLKTMKYSQTLQKCPDKNAKLNFQLTAYMKSQIKPDEVSMASTRTYDIQASINQTQPDFKKKKKDPQILQIAKPINQPSNQPPSIKIKVTNQLQIKSQKQILSKDSTKFEFAKLQEDNKKLKQQIVQFTELQLQNQNLKRLCEQSQKKSISYYKKKQDQMKKQYQQVKSKVQLVKAQMKKKSELEKQMCSCKETMGRLLNYAIMNDNSQLAEQFYNIYQ